MIFDSIISASTLSILSKFNLLNKYCLLAVVPWAVQQAHQINKWINWINKNKYCHIVGVPSFNLFHHLNYLFYKKLEINNLIILFFSFFINNNYVIIVSQVFHEQFNKHIFSMDQPLVFKFKDKKNLSLRVKDIDGGCYIIPCCDVRGVSGGPSIGPPLMPRDASLSDSTSE